MKYIYTALLTPTDDGVGYLARVPDLPGCTTSGRDLDDALEQIADAAGAWLTFAEDEGLPIPSATPQGEIAKESGGVLSLLRIDTIAHRARTDTRAVRKNVSLPAWMAELAEKRGINCSQLLQDSLRQRLNAG